jgi:DNA-binding NarL/FixJ family response regulator
MAEYAILEAATQEQAAIVAQSESPRVIVIDVACPCLDGQAMIRSIKRAAPWAAIVALTMCDHATYRNGLTSAGADHSLLIWDIYADLPRTLRRLNAAQDRCRGHGGGDG